MFDNHAEGGYNNIMKTSNKPAIVFFSLILPAAIYAMGTVKNPEQTPSAGAVSSTEAVSNAAHAITGKAMDREEIWDRRPNPLMGRPDWLEEIILTVRPSSGPDITISIKGEKLLIKYKTITAGSRGVFRVTGRKMPYSLVSFEPFKGSGSREENIVPKKTAKPVPTPKPVKTPIYVTLLESEKISGRDIIKSKTLQDKAVREIAKKYGIKNAAFVTKTSFQGPVPPPGGYVYWGVKGLVKGADHIWQYGYGLRRGSELEDPQRYNKCNSPDTLITTPNGSVPIKDLKPGDLVTSDGKAVKILQVSRVRAVNHKVCRVVFAGGTVLVVSPGHPLPDGRTIGILKEGDMVDGRLVIKNGLIPYRHDFTYDILPDSVSGTYSADGITVGSTLPRD